jgi:hypothetical protein
MEGTRRERARIADLVLLTAIGVDVVLPVLAIARPAWWFSALHVGLAPDALHIALLQRAAAQWVAFAVLQIIALARWRRWPHWLLLVAGARTSDWLTDLTYFVTSPSPSTLRWVLLLPPIFNAGMSLVLFLVWRRQREARAS